MVQHLDFLENVQNGETNSAKNCHDDMSHHNVMTHPDLLAKLGYNHDKMLLNRQENGISSTKLGHKCD